MSRDPLGEEGDFVTSPEISQIFGELVGAWAIHEFLYNPMSKLPDTPIHIIEFGPGRGTMMKDILRITSDLNLLLGIPPYLGKMGHFDPFLKLYESLFSA